MVTVPAPQRSRTLSHYVTDRQRDVTRGLGLPHVTATPPELADDDDLRAADGRVPGRRGRATRQRLLEQTAEMLRTSSYRDLKVVDIAREAGTSPATFYQYFPDVESAILVLAEEMSQTGGGSSADRARRQLEGQGRLRHADGPGRRRARLLGDAPRRAAGGRPGHRRGRRAVPTRSASALLNELTNALAEVIEASARRPAGTRPTSTPWPPPACWCRCWPTWPPTATASSSGASAPTTCSAAWRASSTRPITGQKPPRLTAPTRLGRAVPVRHDVAGERERPHVVAVGLDPDRAIVRGRSARAARPMVHRMSVLGGRAASRGCREQHQAMRRGQSIGTFTRGAHDAGVVAGERRMSRIGAVVVEQCCGGEAP